MGDGRDSGGRFVKGHRGYEKGFTPAALRQLADYTRQRIPNEIMVDWDLALMMNKADVKVELDEDGQPYVTWSERGGITPTLEQRTAAKNRLEIRAWGQPAQSMQIEQSLRIDGAAALQGMTELASNVLAPGSGAWSKIQELIAPGSTRQHMSSRAALLASPIDASSSEVPDPASTGDSGGTASTGHDLGDPPGLASQHDTHNESELDNSDE